MADDVLYPCSRCDGDIHPHRAALGFDVCLPCGEYLARQRKHCTVPLHKSNYIVITDKRELVGINNKGGFVR